MRKAIFLVLIMASIGAAFWLYQLKFETGRMQTRVQQLEQLIENAEKDVAVLRAEWNFLIRPERVERLTKKHLELVPAKAGQYRRLSEFDDLAKTRSSSHRQ